MNKGKRSLEIDLASERAASWCPLCIAAAGAFLDELASAWVALTSRSLCIGRDLDRLCCRRGNRDGTSGGRLHRKSRRPAFRGRRVRAPGADPLNSVLASVGHHDGARWPPLACSPPSGTARAAAKGQPGPRCPLRCRVFAVVGHLGRRTKGASLGAQGDTARRELSVRAPSVTTSGPATAAALWSSRSPNRQWNALRRRDRSGRRPSRAIERGDGGRPPVCRWERFFVCAICSLPFCAPGSRGGRSAGIRQGVQEHRGLLGGLPDLLPACFDERPTHDPATTRCGNGSCYPGVGSYLMPGTPLDFLQVRAAPSAAPRCSANRTGCPVRFLGLTTAERMAASNATAWFIAHEAARHVRITRSLTVRLAVIARGATSGGLLFGFLPRPAFRNEGVGALGHRSGIGDWPSCTP